MWLKSTIKQGISRFYNRHYSAEDAYEFYKKNLDKYDVIFNRKARTEALLLASKNANNGIASLDYTRKLSLSSKPRGRMLTRLERKRRNI